MQLLKKIGEQMNAIFSLLLLMLTCSIAFIPILFIGLFKLIPYPRWQTFCTRVIDQICIIWCGFNNLYVDKCLRVKHEFTGLDQLNRNDWYLVIANHQSWLDIVVLHRLLNRKIPVLKFFVKDQLKWIPLLGFSWWAMGCPFMKRYSKEYLLKNPHKKGQDILSTQKAVEAFKRAPAAIMNFVEGTRFTSKKRELQNSPYLHLLKPKAGGISFIISSMGQHIKSLMDITIIYPEPNHSLWDFLCRRVQSIKVNVRHLPIPTEFTSPHMLQDQSVQAAFKEWLNLQWLEKDRLISSMK